MWIPFATVLLLLQLFTGINAGGGPGPTTTTETTASTSNNTETTASTNDIAETTASTINGTQPVNGTTSSIFEAKQQNFSARSVTFIESEHLLGNFFLAEDLVISEEYVFHIHSADSMCICRMRCSSHPRCMAFSTEVSGNAFLCKLSDMGPLNSTLIMSTNANYAYRQESLPGNSLGILEDSLLYHDLGLHGNIISAKNNCSKIPGFRLGIYSKSSASVFDMINSVSDPGGFFIDLQRFENGSIYWGDNNLFQNIANVILYPDPDFSLAYPNHFYKYGDAYLQNHPIRGFIRQKGGDLNRIVCQANPLGVEW